MFWWGVAAAAILAFLAFGRVLDWRYTPPPAGSLRLEGPPLVSTVPNSIFRDRPALRVECNFKSSSRRPMTIRGLASFYVNGLAASHVQGTKFPVWKPSLDLGESVKIIMIHERLPSPESGSMKIECKVTYDLNYGQTGSPYYMPRKTGRILIIEGTISDVRAVGPVETTFSFDERQIEL